jgi:hypothetical protein
MNRTSLIKEFQSLSGLTYNRGHRSYLQEISILKRLMKVGSFNCLLWLPSSALDRKFYRFFAAEIEICWSMVVEIEGQVYRPTDVVRGEFYSLPDSTDPLTVVPSTVMEH